MGKLFAACLTAVGGLIFGLPGGFAQESGDQLEEIVVTAPWAVTRKVESRTPAGKVELISLSRRVYYGDLNLANHADVVTLEQRINDVAKDSCGHLAEMYPLSDPSVQSCAAQAVASAKPQLDEVIASAGKAPR
jgi:UrcA family protein